MTHRYSLAGYGRRVHEVPITDATRRTILRALELERRFDAGIFPRGSSQHRHFLRLVDTGLLADAGTGMDIDGEVDGEVQLYRLTDEGRALAARLEGSTT